jgi:hypothetical protein
MCIGLAAMSQEEFPVLFPGNREFQDAQSRAAAAGERNHNEKMARNHLTGGMLARLGAFCNLYIQRVPPPHRRATGAPRIWGAERKWPCRQPQASGERAGSPSELTSSRRADGR